MDLSIRSSKATDVSEPWTGPWIQTFTNLSQIEELSRLHHHINLNNLSILVLSLLGDGNPLALPSDKDLV